uniref:Uncharacterized protein n=1 Tax=Romanomermis culicivorax TaxID=13658 RepID=A0A915I3A3_ROMCU
MLNTQLLGLKLVRDGANNLIDSLDSGNIVGRNFPKKMGKGTGNPQQALMRKWFHTEHHIELGKPQEWQDNCFFFIDGLETLTPGLMYPMM